MSSKKTSFLVIGISMVLAQPVLGDQKTPSILTKKQKLTAEQITSIFENSTINFAYDYLEDIDDGAGATAGRVGFNTNAGDLLGVVKEYLAAKPVSPKQPLSDYVACLAAIQGTSNYKCLYPSVDAHEMATPEFKSHGLLEVDFGSAWVAAASDPMMKEAQDDFVEVHYFEPAMAWANKLGLQTAFGDAVIYDTVIQIGLLSELEKKTQAQFAETHQGRVKPTNRTEETEWLRIFLAVRKAKLSETPVGAAVVRIDSLGQVLDTGNLDLELPISFIYDGGHFTLKK